MLLYDQHSHSHSRHGHHRHSSAALTRRPWRRSIVKQDVCMLWLRARSCCTALPCLRAHVAKGLGTLFPDSCNHTCMQHAIARSSCLRETSLLASFGSHPVYLWCLHSVTFSCNHASEATIVEPRPLGKTQRGPDSPVSITPYRWIHRVERQKHGHHASCASIGSFAGFIVR